ncbi:Bck1p [Rhizophagus irregularis DAOM 197198w]|uniref:Bck1p n=1 Tax=Rhizophagus irregularis (strain DAOM 197198w) TaxID=1432141 RepID=A0A015M518_RHIIW|nr:Bck1p [Rhizophagus irregularis DAOM 197198w]
MDLINVNDENSFDPTPKLKSSPVPIFFVSFNLRDEYCFHCGGVYTKTLIYEQKYCKKCLSCYLTKITDNNIYLDVYLFAEDLECSEHEINGTKVSRNIQECCRNCLTILVFKQIRSYTSESKKIPIYKNVFESEKYCKLCGKLLYQGTDHNIITEFKLCSNCYLISIGYIESTLTKKPISIIYLPWWENRFSCFCFEELILTSNCQKYCENCFIFFIGCRFCLTTNVIFGYTNQSQCKKCKRVSTITFDITKMIGINSGDSVLDDFLVSIRSYQLEIANFANNVKSIDEYFVPFEMCCISICDNFKGLLMRYIPYSQFTNVKEITKGGFSIVYQATRLNGSNKNIYRFLTRDNIVILKRFKNSQFAEKYFMNELKINHHYGSYETIIKTHGFTKDPKLDDYILVMQYAQNGDLHKLRTIHNAKFIHRDFHSGNILVDYPAKIKIGDLGLSRPANDTSSDNEIYGVIPYIAPEIFKGSVYSKESDIYSLGMIMWELTTGCKPFANIEHDHILIFNIMDGVRPEITEDTPECYANIMKSCWDSDPKKRPSIKEIYYTCETWRCHNYDEPLKYYHDQFNQAELKRKNLIVSKKLGSKFSEKPHPKAIYTSRSLNSYISKCSSIFTNCSSINFSSNDYISKEFELGIGIESELNVLGTKRNIEELNINSYENNGKYTVLFD